jgi:hypothetical protein
MPAVMWVILTVKTYEDSEPEYTVLGPFDTARRAREYGEAHKEEFHGDWQVELVYPPSG